MLRYLPLPGNRAQSLRVFSLVTGMHVPAFFRAQFLHFFVREISAFF